VSVFLACTVEAVEALTIVLAVAATRGWSSAMSGVVSAALLLTALVGVLGPALTQLPIDILRTVVGALLLIFGLQWLRKAILRAAGLKAKHDERQVYRHELDAARQLGPTGRGLDRYGFAVAFKGVLLEGLEVAFIVLTFGANQHRVGVAALAAALAVLLVIAVGAAVRAPLARVPENTMKLAVGVMLSSFGMFWGTEGVGASWPGGDASLLVIVPALLLIAMAIARRVSADAQAALDGEDDTRDSGSPEPDRRHGRVAQALLGVWEFVVGDDWRTAGGVVLALVLTSLAANASASAWWIMPLAVGGLLVFSIHHARHQVSPMRHAGGA
jgi:uncharacterized membrane protein